MIPRCIQLARRQCGTRRQNTGKLAAHEFTGLGGLSLIADGDFLPGRQKLVDVVIRGMRRQSRHGIILPLRQRESEETGSDDGILKEQLKEIPQPKEQQGVAREAALHLEVLLHHGSEFLGRGRHAVKGDGTMKPPKHTKKVGAIDGQGSRLAGLLGCHRDLARSFASFMAAAVQLFHRDLGGAGNPPLVILHGMLGSSRNWQTVGRDLAMTFHVFALDLRNHGQSPHAEGMDYPTMMEDVLAWLDAQQLDRVTLVGHSMGGKIAMLLACRRPERVERLVIVDIAPKNYFWVAHRAEFDAMNALDLEHLASRAEAELRFEARVDDWAMRKFLLTNLERTGESGWRWQINLPALTAGLQILEKTPLHDGDRFDGPVRFVLGERSVYVSNHDHASIRRHFPAATFVTIANAGHNPHMDQRESFVRAVLPASA